MEVKWEQGRSGAGQEQGGARHGVGRERGVAEIGTGTQWRCAAEIGTERGTAEQGANKIWLTLARGDVGQGSVLGSGPNHYLDGRALSGKADSSPC